MGTLLRKESGFGILKKLTLSTRVPGRGKVAMLQTRGWGSGGVCC